MAAKIWGAVIPMRGMRSPISFRIVPFHIMHIRFEMEPCQTRRGGSFCREEGPRVRQVMRA
jgi:hypothetical protein